MEDVSNILKNYSQHNLTMSKSISSLFFKSIESNISNNKNIKHPIEAVITNYSDQIQALMSLLICPENTHDKNKQLQIFDKFREAFGFEQIKLDQSKISQFAVSADNSKQKDAFYQYSYLGSIKDINKSSNHRTLTTAPFLDQQHLFYYLSLIFNIGKIEIPVESLQDTSKKKYFKT